MLVSRIRFLLLAATCFVLADGAPPLSSNEPLAANAKKPMTTSEAAQAFARMPILFEANEGQFADGIRFVAHKGAASLAFGDDGAKLVISKAIQPSGAEAHHHRGARKHEPRVVVGLKVDGGRKVAPRGTGELETRTNYYHGDDPAKWRTNVPTYAKVEYPQVRDGVDLVYHSDNGALEYDFVVAPGTDVASVAMDVEGASDLSLTPEGDLAIKTATGSFVQQRPLVYQRGDGGRKEPVASRYKLVGDRVGFEVASYDHARSLVIDPVIGFSTFIGGSGGDAAEAVAADSAGNTFVTGESDSLDGFPLTDGSELNGGVAPPEGVPTDAFVAKLDPTGTHFVYATYVGGSSSDGADGIAVGADGNAYIVGTTVSQDFPAAGGANSTFVGQEDVFVARFDPVGARVWGTYIAGSNDQQGYAIALGPGPAPGVFVTGWTSSNDFTNPAIVVRGLGLDGLPPPPPNPQRVFVVQVNPNGATFDSQAYLTPADANFNSGYGITVDSTGHAYVTGEADSATFPTVGFPKCPPAAFVGNSLAIGDVFVAKLGTGPTPTWDWVECLGGTDGFDSGNAIALDFNFNVYVGGEAQSTNFPVTPGALQGTNAGGFDALALKLDNTGVVSWATYLGGNSSDVANGIGVDGSGQAWLAGTSNSDNFPQVNGLPPLAGGGTHCPDGCPDDIFVSRLSASGASLGFSTLFGTNSNEEALAIAVTPSSIHVAGETNSSSFPVFPPNAAEATFGGGSDGVVVKIATQPLLINPTSASLQPGGTRQFGATGGVAPYVFSLTKDGSGGAVTAAGAYSAGITGNTTDTVTVTDAAGETASATVSVGANSTALIISPASTSSPPRGQRAFAASGGVPPYTFSFVSNASVGVITSSGGYTAGSRGSVTDIVRVTDAIGSTANATIIVGAGISITPTKPSVAPGGTVTFSATGGSGGGYNWTISQNLSSGSIGAADGIYQAGTGTSVVDTIVVTDTLGNSATVQVSVGSGLAIDPAAPSTTTKGKIPFTAFGGAGGFQWSVVKAPSGGTIDGVTGVYTAGTTGNVLDTIKVTDSVGKFAQVDIHVGPSLTITPSTTNVVAGDKVQFSAAGGSGLEYKYSVSHNESGGNVDGLGGYIAGDNAGTDTVHLTDSLGNTADATVHVAAKPVVPGVDAGVGVPVTTSDGGTVGINIGGGGSDNCGCRTVGAPTDGTGARMIAGLALAVGLALRRRRRQR